jgi:Uma2 family endonuclease
MLKTPIKPLTWQDVLNDPSLQDLPYKIELNERGEIVMSPATNLHGLYQIEIADLLKTLTTGGKRISKCSVQTRKGVKVADVAWLSPGFVALNGLDTPYDRAPDVCVEIISPSNTKAATREKIRLYFERGAHEVWTCDLEGNVQFYSTDGNLERSAVVPGFPTHVPLE